jgi:glutamate-1-semialdehyde 2,1-aminomutase
LHAKTSGFVKDIQDFVAERGYQVKIFTIGSIFWFAFTDQESITTAEQIDPASMLKFKEMHRELINRGIYLGPSGYEVGFISAAHTTTDLETTKTAIFDSLDIVFGK